MREYATTVRYVWSQADVEGAMVFPEVGARHAQLKLRAYAPTSGMQPRVRWLPITGQWEVEFTVCGIDAPPQAIAIEAASALVLRNVAPWAKAESVFRIDTTTRQVTPPGYASRVLLD
ncbi:MAG: hypothetical protein QOF36_2559 [Microbacteriaceae bacterium]|jgi:hypothetical protein|nr:hypothetical protein [Microbacteriaceae bacterium]